MNSFLTGIGVVRTNLDGQD